MRAVLRPHPDFPSPGIAVEAEAERFEGRLWLTYRMSGDVEAVRFPPTCTTTRADELWRHTCFEAFVATASAAYYEVNVATSGEWATYRFDSYRQGIAPAAPEVVLHEWEATSRTFVLRAEVGLDRTHDLAGDWRLGLAAVIEATDGRISYWSVAHPAGKPDFHHRDCLALELPAPEAA
jgi:hypothetical protein